MSASEFSVNLVKLNDLDVNKITITKAKKNKNEGSSGSVKYNGQYFTLALEKMCTPFGLSPYKEKDSKGNVIASSNEKWYLSFPLPNLNTNMNCEPVYEKLFNKMNDFDTTLKNIFLQENDISNSYLGPKKKNIYALESIYKGCIKVPQDPKPDKSSVFQASVITDGPYKTQFYDKNKKLLDISFDSTKPDEPNYALKVVPKGSLCVISVSPMLYVTSTLCGVKWQVRQCVVYPHTINIPNKCILEIEAEDDSTEQTEDPKLDTTCTNTSDPETPDVGSTEYE